MVNRNKAILWGGDDSIIDDFKFVAVRYTPVCVKNKWHTPHSTLALENSHFINLNDTCAHI